MDSPMFSLNSNKPLLDSYACVTPNLSSLNKNIYISEFFWVRNLGVDDSFAGLSSGFLRKLQSGCQLGLQSSEGWSGTGGSISKAAHSHTWQVNAGCFQETVVLCHKAVSIALLEQFAGMAAGFLQSK